MVILMFTVRYRLIIFSLRVTLLYQVQAQKLLLLDQGTMVPQRLVTDEAGKRGSFTVTADALVVAGGITYVGYNDGSLFAILF